jgi:hypothetical protein
MHNKTQLQGRSQPMAISAVGSFLHSQANSTQVESMQSLFFRSVPRAGSALVVTVLLGCASAAITPDVLEDRTSRAVGLEKGQFTIADRVDEATATRYFVVTKTNRKYSCSVGATFSVVGRIVTDAICTEMGKPAGSANSNPNSANCNALLKAAGKC